jgi:hypothetical protein
MRATTVLRKCLMPALDSLHALRRQTLLLAVESLLAGHRLVLIDLARSWIGGGRSFLCAIQITFSASQQLHSIRTLSRL